MKTAQALRPCVTPNCMSHARGHFCTGCWKLLPWDLKAAITTASKKKQRQKEALDNALEFMKNLAQTDPTHKEDPHAAADHRN